MGSNKYEFDSLGDMVTDLLGAFMKVKAKTMFMHDEEKKKQVMMDAFRPFLNQHNIGMLFSDSNIEKVRTGIISGLQKMEEHYIFYLEPTTDKKDVIWGLSTRAAADGAVTPTASNYISQLNQETILRIIQKFIPNAEL